MLGRLKSRISTLMMWPTIWLMSADSEGLPSGFTLWHSIAYWLLCTLLWLADLVNWFWRSCYMMLVSLYLRIYPVHINHTGKDIRNGRKSYKISSTIGST